MEQAVHLKCSCVVVKPGLKSVGFDQLVHVIL